MNSCQDQSAANPLMKSSSWLYLKVLDSQHRHIIVSNRGLFIQQENQKNMRFF
jgi:hypothetical protein